MSPARFERDVQRDIAAMMEEGARLAEAEALGTPPNAAERATAAKVERRNSDLLIAALAPFVAAYEERADPIGDSDLDNEQPRGVFVTLGDCRRAAMALNKVQS